MEAALRHLRAVDPALIPWIDQIGPFALQTQPHGFATLVYAIISQQISLTAARAIRDRLAAALGDITPTAILAAGDTTLRAAGLSTQKIASLYDLAARVSDGRLNLAQLASLDDETAIAHLTAARGIGRWTAEIYLIFGLGRLDILPATDLGLRDAIRLVDELPKIPSPSELLARGERWRPYRSVACWYLWQIRRIITQR
ncbi:DNA-3-methyladenine glycosylase family protein [Chloroflexus sp.]|uniref:DNA-3-methyladenine glycosylase family protein n=1 Tax=Chloroflexus sp. TaxID=1904827 RepID=UPI002628B167|nr:DNA-3-methyladenine glycosylase 2 family protein [uncultured Chloroflexus sp.]